jgi:hypothetical protein
MRENRGLMSKHISLLYLPPLTPKKLRNLLSDTLVYWEGSTVLEEDTENTIYIVGK